MAKSDPLARYKAKRDFTRSAEPREGGAANATAPSFVIQKHWASRLHYDFRLELDGSMKSWAVPKGPSFDPADKRMAMHVEDHPISYKDFEGEIPAGQYGAGKVIVWDKGSWNPLGDARKGYRQGKLEFELHGHKLRGRWVLLRMKGKSEKQDPWLLIKERDEFVRPSTEFSVVDEMPDSVSRLPGDPAAPAAPSRAGKKSTLPTALTPELATLVDSAPPDADQWIYEIKFDGYRLLARIQDGKIRLFTRNGNDWTGKLAGLARRLGSMKLPDGWYDGEIVVLDEAGLPDFQALQGAFDTARTEKIVYYLFDLPFCDGLDLRQLPLLERRKRLETLLSGTGRDSGHDAVRYSASFDENAQDMVASACKMGLEGIIGKRKTSPYTSRRSTDWIKLKCGQRQEFIIGGYTDPKGSRSGIGSLLLGVHDADGALLYAGNVGSGFNGKMLDAVKQKLEKLHTSRNPFSTTTGIDRNAHWVRPELVAEVSFGQWTRTGRIRHSVFRGLRSDKPASAIVRETTMPSEAIRQSRRPDAAAAPKSAGGLGNLKVTHPERIIESSSGIRKIDLVRYYNLVGPLMMEHLKGRPVSLVRAPEGVQGQLFFQKHLETASMAGIRQLSKKLDPGHDPLMEIASPQGLLSAAQMNVIELHTWNATKTLIDRPDRMTFDLDPGKGVEWPAMQEAALLLRAFLQELELHPFVKTSGGKGLHVVVPIQRRHGWDTVKDFSHAVVLHMAATLPRRFAAKSGPRNRVGKIFIDYLRNGFGATTVCAWSARARPGMGVSVPVGWEEVEKLKGSAQWAVQNIHERLDTGNAPWAAYAKSSRSLGPAMKILKFKPEE
ncbi:DNA ligase D [Pollutimonas sp. H1-120]|uniref:DNA ligase D n=1 Tax=Pollutimonas sp. H1-120 TaxID=3148824 RepID=UPI003B521D40